MSASIVAAVASLLADPESVFSADAILPSFAVGVDGASVTLRDELSYENGAPGALSALHFLDRAQPLGAYADFVRKRIALITDPRWPDQAGTMQGVVIASSLLAECDSSWERVRAAGFKSLIRKARGAVEMIDRAVDGARPIDSFGRYDVIRGLSRDIVILLSRPDEISDSFLMQVGSGLLRTLSGEDGRPLPVTGGAFFGAEEVTSHRNFGNAHGSTGVARSLLLVDRELRRRGIDASLIRGAVTRYCDWVLSVQVAGAPPMFDIVSSVSGEHGWSGSQSRPSWCYGAPGHQALLLSAGLMYDRPDWVTRSERELLSAAERFDECDDNSLCHGTAGVVATLALAGASIDSAELLEAAVVTGERLGTCYSADSDYGFSYTSKGLAEPAQVPGMLNGAAGVAVALSLTLCDRLDESVAREWLLRQSPWLILS